jgi:hypothetical protein
MASFTRASTGALLLAAGLAAVGCAADGEFTTGSLGTQTAYESQVDPACVTLTSRIEALRKEGIADKIEKAALKKYKLTQADITKADQLTKANAEFQLRCSTLTPKQTAAAQVSSQPAMAATAPAPKSSQKAAKTAGQQLPGDQN